MKWFKLLNWLQNSLLPPPFVYLLLRSDAMQFKKTFIWEYLIADNYGVPTNIDK